jgi:hypothetical protein
LLTQPHGGEAIRTMIIDDIHKALDEGRVRHAADGSGANDPSRTAGCPPS